MPRDSNDDNVIVVPAIPIHVAVQALRTVEEGLEHLLDYAWDTDERQLARRIDEGLKEASKLISSVVKDLPEDDAGKEAYAKRYLEKASEADSPLQESMRRYILSEDGGEQQQGRQEQLTEADVMEGLAFVRTLFKELGEELLRFSKDDLEEVAELVLAVARMWLDIGHKMTRKALGMLEKDYALEEEVQGDRKGPRVEEATDEEIEAFYRARGEEPPPRSEIYPVQEEKASITGASQSAAPKRRRRRAPARLLWQPLTPALKDLVTNLPTSKGYTAYGHSLEGVVDDGLQMARLGYVMARLTARQGYRVVKRQLVKVGADPRAAVIKGCSCVVDAAIHPVRTVKYVYEGAKEAVQGVYSCVTWLRT